MNEAEFNNLVKGNRYHVFVFSCPISLPLNFAIHTWTVIVENGKPTRFDVAALHNFGRGKNCLHINVQKPWRGFQVFFLSKDVTKEPCFESNLIFHLSGNENSKASKAVKLIKENASSYPDAKNYRIFGPNSNTFTSWLIRKAKIRINLPFRAFGKDFYLRNGNYEKN